MSDSGVQDRPSIRTRHAADGEEATFPTGQIPLGHPRFPFGSGRSSEGKRKPHVILLGSAETEVASQLQEWIEGRGVRLTIATTPTVAIELIEDCVHLQVALDGLLVAHDLPGGHSDRAIRDFGRDFPHAPVAITMVHDDLAMVIWAKTRRIAFLEYPPTRSSVDGWVAAVLRRWDSSTNNKVDYVVEQGAGTVEE